MNYKTLIEQTTKTLEELAKDYGHPKDNFAQIAKRWSMILGEQVSAAQVALMMLELKIAKLQKNLQHLDTVIDIICYASCLFEL